MPEITTRPSPGPRRVTRTLSVVVIALAVVYAAIIALLCVVGFGTMGLHDALGGSEGTALSLAALFFISALALGAVLSVALILARRRHGRVAVGVLLGGLLVCLTAAFVLGLI